MIGSAYTLLDVVLWGAWLTAITFVLWRSDGLVRAVACLYFVATVAAVVAQAYGAPPAVWAYADIVVLPLLAWALLREPRPWLAWACAFELVTVATHVAWALDRRIQDEAYSATINLWWMLELAALVWGSVKSRRPPQPNAELVGDAGAA